MSCDDGKAEAPSETQQPETEAEHPDPQTKHSPSSPIGISMALWNNRRPPKRKG
jgi:hypothetical protein